MTQIRHVFVRRVFFMMLVCWLSACATTVRTTVSTYKAPQTLPSAGSFVVRPVPDAKPDKLEFRFYADKLAAQFERLGYQRATNTVAPDLVVYLQYDVLRERKDRDGASRVGFSSGFGSYYRYGSVVVVDSIDHDRFEYLRKVKVQIVRPVASGEPEELLSLSGMSRGECEHLSSVFDEMVEALFHNLDSANGSVSTTSIKTPRSCLGT